MDLYCERVGPGLWAEPNNALTNLAFFVAAWAVWRSALARQSFSPAIGLLIGLMVAIGTGSALFHTFATDWAKALDEAPILLFQILYLWLYSRRVVNLGSGAIGGLLAGFLVILYVSGQFPHLLNDSLGYAPALLLLFGLGLYHYRQEKDERALLLAAAGVFLLSLFFRTIDQSVCPYFPVGTHFLWHLMNALLLYLVTRGLLVNLPSPADGTYRPAPT